MGSIKIVAVGIDGKAVTETLDNKCSLRVSYSSNQKIASIARNVETAESNMLSIYEKLNDLGSISKIEVYGIEGDDEIRLYTDKAIEDKYMIHFEYVVRQREDRIADNIYIEALEFNRDYITINSAN